MPLMLTDAQRAELEAAARAEKGVRRWKRYRAVLLRGEGLTVAAVAAALRCSEASVYAWTARWRRDGVAGLREGDHGGGRVKLDAAGEELLESLVGHRSPGPRPPGHRLDGAAAAGRTGGGGLPCRGAHDPPRLASPRVSLETAALRPGPARSGLRRKKGAVIAAAQRCWPPVARSGWPMRRRCGSSRRCAPAGASGGSRRACSSAGATSAAPSSGR